MAAFLRLFFFLLAFSLLAWAGPEKLDPLLRAMLAAQTEPGLSALLHPELLPTLLSASWTAVEASPLHQAPVAQGVVVRAFVLLADERAELAGFHVRQHVGRLLIGDVPLHVLPKLAEQPGVVFVQPSRPVEPQLDRSVVEAGVPALWYGSPATTGQGVIVGIVDSGVDILHKDFRSDRDASGTERGSRILWLWDQSLPGGGRRPAWWGDLPTEPIYGAFYSRADLEAFIAAGTNPSPDTLGHGTHVAGIAAGDGSSSTLNLRGVAPGADLVVVKSTFFEDTVVDGVRFVFEAAQAEGRPAVVNLSLGGHGGPHDGTSLFEQAIDALLDRPGRAVVVAGGNEGNKKIHVGSDVRTPTTWTLVAEAATVAVNFWYTPRATFSLTVRAPTGETVSASPGAQRTWVTPAGTVWIDNSVLPDPRNGDKTATLLISGTAPGSRWSITWTPVWGGGRVDGWVESPASGWFVEGDNTMTIAEPGNARRVITVGAYVSKTEWSSLAGPQRGDGEVGALATFSSRGPTRDGRLKPDLAAPGAWIASAKSRAAQFADRYTLPDGEHAMLLGTSMAAPHVAGVVALLFSRWPHLAWTEVKEVLVQGARADAFVGPVPSHAWGAGKLFAPRSAELVQGPTPVENPVLLVAGNPVGREAWFQYRLPPGTAWAELQVYDLLGRLVYRANLHGESGDVRWPLTTSAGQPVGSGLYLAVVVTDRGRSGIVRLVVQR